MALPRGVALVNYVGHSGPRDWSFDDLYDSKQVSALVNPSNPTLVMQWGCWTTYYVSPTEDTIGHAFMLNQNGGAAAVLGAATLTQAKSERQLGALVYERLFREGATLGETVLKAKRAYVKQYGMDADVIHGWTILGDPAIQVSDQ